jgi:phosphotransferase system enzyme I (PtsI)
MAAEPVYAVVLLGLGLDEFSMNPLSIPKVKKVLRMSRFDESRSLVEQLFQFPTASEIEGFLRSWMAKRFPEDFIECYLEKSKV